MRRLQRINLNRDLWASSSSEDDEQMSVHIQTNNNDHGKEILNPLPSSRTTTARFIPSECVSSIDDIHARLALLPAYPSLEKSSKTNLQDHLLLVNVSRMFLNKESSFSCYYSLFIFLSLRSTID